MKFGVVGTRKRSVSNGEVSIAQSEVMYLWDQEWCCISEGGMV